MWTNTVALVGNRVRAPERFVENQAKVSAQVSGKRIW